VAELSNLIERLGDAARERTPEVAVNGRLFRSAGQSLHVSGCDAGVGDECIVDGEGHSVVAEVVGFAEGISFLAPLGDVTGLRPGASVRVQRSRARPRQDALLGRVMNGLGEPLDGRPLPSELGPPREKLNRINPLDRRPISVPLDVGVRALNGLFTIGQGQRIGLFAGSGVGKSVLLGMMARFVAADVVVVGLIGERGREVREFIDDNLGTSGLARSVVVASPADDAPVLRLRAARLATDIAHRYRVLGKHVLLVMDSLTRVAQAQREIGLAVGEPPTSKGYPPSVFSLLPRLVEQAGSIAPGTGSITAFYTVLAEGDDQQDPVVDASRAVLDGHIVLSRRLAESGHYPSVDVEASISRVMPRIVDASQLAAATRFRELMSRYSQQQDLINVGAYVAGSDAVTDRAIKLRPELLAYLRQDANERADLQESRERLARLLSSG